MVDAFINKQKSKADGYNTTQCLRMFGVSDSGYYAWRGRRDDVFGKRAEKKAERDNIKEKMRRIIVARNGVCLVREHSEWSFSGGLALPLIPSVYLLS